MSTLAANILAATSHSEGLSIICMILLIFGLIGLVVGLADLTGIVGNRLGRLSGGGALVIGVVLLIIWFVAC